MVKSPFEESVRHLKIARGIIDGKVKPWVIFARERDMMLGCEGLQVAHTGRPFLSGNVERPDEVGYGVECAGTVTGCNLVRTDSGV